MRQKNDEMMGIMFGHKTVKSDMGNSNSRDSRRKDEKPRDSFVKMRDSVKENKTAVKTRKPQMVAQ